MLVALTGDWFGGGALLASGPVRTTSVVDDLDDVPAVPESPGDFAGGGWIGTLDYDGSARFGWYDSVLRHRDGRWWFEALWTPARAADLDAALQRWRALLAAPDDDPGWELGPVALPPRAGHLAAVERAVELIRAGELYQVNVCTRAVAAFAGSAAGLFAALVAQLSPARGALLGDSARRVVCVSPELFLAADGRDVRTAPIKGTLPRSGPGDGNDARLRASAKDAAENVMIVDLLRNDLGRVARPGTVRVADLLDVQPHPGVWHLVSTVRAQLRDDVTTSGLLAATFPPGSVTGAPKLRALDAIADLEAAPRGAYTGALGAVLAGGRTEFAVTIRSFEISDGHAELGVGGGITADSVPMAEWHECRHKAAPLLRVAGAALPADPLPTLPDDRALLETVLALDGAAVRLADHLARLDRSTRELTGRGLPAGLAHRVHETAAALGPGRGVIRIVVRDGAATVTGAAAGPPPAGSDAVTRTRPPGSWRHKWAERAGLTRAEHDVAPAVPLFVATDGTVLETSRGNVFLLRADGGLVTPPLRDDLLPGVTRRAVLDLARDTGRPVELREFGVAELLRHAAFWTSSLSGAVPLRSLDGTALPAAEAEIRAIAQVLLGGRRPDR